MTDCAGTLRPSPAILLQNGRGGAQNYRAKRRLVDAKKRRPSSFECDSTLTFRDNSAPRRTSMRIGVIGMLCCLCSGMAAAQSLRSVVGAYSTSIEFDGQSVIYTFSNAREGRTSRAVANLADIDLSLSSVHGESTIYLTLRCKSGASCWDYGGPISPEQLYGDRLQYPECNSHAECQNFLDQLRTAALSTPEPYRPPPPPIRQPAPPETVIDGSNIPSRIDFPPRATMPKPAPASPRPATPAPATPPPQIGRAHV